MLQIFLYCCLIFGCESSFRSLKLFMLVVNRQQKAFLCFICSGYYMKTITILRIKSTYFFIFYFYMSITTETQIVPPTRTDIIKCYFPLSHRECSDNIRAEVSSSHTFYSATVHCSAHPSLQRCSTLTTVKLQTNLQRRCM